MRQRTATGGRYDARRAVRAVVGGELESVLRPLVQKADRTIVEDATRHALAFGSGLGPDAGWLVAAGFVADLVAGVAARRPQETVELGPLLEALADRHEVGLDLVQRVTFRRAVRNATLLGQPDPAEAVVGLLGLFAPASEASLWLRGHVDAVRLVAFAGEREPTRAVKAAAQTELVDTPPAVNGRGRRRIHACSVRSFGERRGALVVRAGAERDRVLACTEDAAEVLGFLLECGFLAENEAAGRTTFVESEELLLRIVGFDLHDGPLQELARLRGDLQVARRRVAESLTAPGPPAGLAEQLDSMIGLAVGAENGLRRMARSLAVPPYLEEPFSVAIEKGLATFAGTQIRHKLVAEGELDSLPQPQRIAIVSIVREALANARAHSAATEIRVTLRADDKRACLEIVDNGVGFDVDRSVAKAARGGRLGLISIRERARLLGGSCVLTSKPGGPTRVSVVLPVHRPSLRDPL